MLVGTENPAAIMPGDKRGSTRGVDRAVPVRQRSAPCSEPGDVADVAEDRAAPTGPNAGLDAV